MLIPYENKKIYLASNPVDFRMSIDGLSELIQKEKSTYLHDGSIYVFYNRNQDKIKCLFWDRNGFVLYYKRLDKCTFKFKKMLNAIEDITPDELNILLSGFEPEPLAKQPRMLNSIAS